MSGVHVELIHGDVEAIKYNLVMNQSCCLSTDVTEKLKFREKFIICKQETCSLVSHWQPSHSMKEARLRTKPTQCEGRASTTEKWSQSPDQTVLEGCPTTKLFITRTDKALLMFKPHCMFYSLQSNTS